MIEQEDIRYFANIRVVGVGGGGCNAVNRMVQSDMKGIEFITVNTDFQALQRTEPIKKIHIGDKVSKGLGAGGNPAIGQASAEQNAEELYEALRDSDMVFITAGMGGGTGTGAATVIAQIAQEIGALTVAVVTKPFTFEGAKRKAAAEEGLAKLKEKVDTLITIPNDRLLQVVERKTSVEAAFRVVDDILRQGIQGISELITVPGLINLDFADVKAIMATAGSALMAIGRGEGETRATDAAKAAIASPLLEVSIDGAKGVLFNITGGTDMTLFEVTEAADVISKAADPDANIIFGAVIDPKVQNEIRITVIATGFDGRTSVVKPIQTSAARSLREVPLFSQEGDNYDVPPFIRNQSPQRKEAAPVPVNERQSFPRKDGNPPNDGDGHIEIPAFLRRR